MVNVCTSSANEWWSQLAVLISDKQNEHVCIVQAVSGFFQLLLQCISDNTECTLSRPTVWCTSTSIIAPEKPRLRINGGEGALQSFVLEPLVEAIALNGSFSVTLCKCCNNDFYCFEQHTLPCRSTISQLLLSEGVIASCCTQPGYCRAERWKMTLDLMSK